MTLKQKQALLAYFGYYDGPLDGIWGEGSQQATICFRREYMEPEDVDGNFGPKTEKRILEVIATGEKPKESVQIDTAPGWWKDIRYFTREEFKCKCGGKYCNGYPAEPDERMVRIADQLRKNLGVPVTIVSGLRCKTWNAIQGGVSNSKHMYGEAADIYAKGVPQSLVEAELDKIGGVRYHYAIKGSNNVHFDVPKGNR